METQQQQPGVDYTNVDKNLSVFESLNSEPTIFNALLGRKNADRNDVDVGNDCSADEYRYQVLILQNLQFGRKIFGLFY
jgi:hypothetical protein